MSLVATITAKNGLTPHEKKQELKDRTRGESDQNINVSIRCRPLDASRHERRAHVDIDPIHKEIKVQDRNYVRSFNYDNVFDASVGQAEVYGEVVAPLISEVLAGYNCTVFAYGQTGTGKTYTMEGERTDSNLSWEADPKAGVVPRALDQLIETLNDGQLDYGIRVSYMELYNEKLYDLLATNDDLESLNIYDDGPRQKINKLSEVAVTTKDEVFDILKKGSDKRQKAATKLNACSSRSHTIFTVNVRVKDKTDVLDGEDLYRIGKLNLVDLAGSENIGRSGAVEKRAAEAGSINKSLLTLGRVITCLENKNPHIPYRESKLTRLLQDSLGGRTKTSIIATISPNIQDLEDTLSTLEYAQRAKKITNKPVVNEKTTQKLMVRELISENAILRRDLEALRGGDHAFFIDRDNYEKMNTRIDLLTKDVEEKDMKITDVLNEIQTIQMSLLETQQQLQESNIRLKETSETLEKTEVDLKDTKDNLTHVTQDRNEQKYLVKVHTKTEKVLSSQAQKLLDVAETTTTHVSKLHQKVDRISDLESENLSKADSAFGSFKSAEAKLVSIVRNDVTGSSLDDLTGALTSKLSGVNLSRPTERLNSIESVVTSFDCSIRGSIVSEQEKVTDQMIKRQEDYQKFAKNIESHQKQKDQNDELWGQKQQLMADEIERLKQMMKQRDEAHKQTIQEILTDGSRIQSQNMEMLVKQEETIDRLHLEIIALKESVAAHKTAMNKSHAVWTLGIQQKNDDLIQTDEKISAAFDTNGQQVIENFATCRVEAIKSLVGTIEDENSLYQNVLKGYREDQLLASHIMKSTEKSFREKEQEIHQMKQTVASGIHEVMSLQSQVSDELNDVKQELEGEASVVKIHHNHFLKSILTGITDASVHFEKLVQADLKRDVPTGETPAKTNYTYPKDLVHVSPHDRILERYRQNPDVSFEILAEDSATNGSTHDDESEDGSSQPERPSSAASSSTISSGRNSSIENRPLESSSRSSSTASLNDMTSGKSSRLPIKDPLKKMKKVLEDKNDDLQQKKSVLQSSKVISNI